MTKSLMTELRSSRLTPGSIDTCMSAKSVIHTLATFTDAPLATKSPRPSLPSDSDSFRPCTGRSTPDPGHPRRRWKACIRTHTNARQEVQAPQKPVIECRPRAAKRGDSGRCVANVKGIRHATIPVRGGSWKQPNNNNKIIADNLRIYTPMLHRNRPIRTFLIEGIDPVGQVLPFQGGLAVFGGHLSAARYSYSAWGMRSVLCYWLVWRGEVESGAKSARPKVRRRRNVEGSGINTVLQVGSLYMK